MKWLSYPLIQAGTILIWPGKCWKGLETQYKELTFHCWYDILLDREEAWHSFYVVTEALYNVWSLFSKLDSGHHDSSEINSSFGIILVGLLFQQFCGTETFAKNSKTKIFAISFLHHHLKNLNSCLDSVYTPLPNTICVLC